MTKPDKEIYPTLYFIVAVIVIFLCGYLLVKDINPIADEMAHYGQITDILENKNLFPNTCPYLPGYHWTIVGLCTLVQNSTGAVLRLLSSFLSLLCFMSFFATAKQIDKPSAVSKSWLFLFSPILFPFFFLLYTDMYAMMFVLLALWFAFKQRLWLSGLVGILGLLVRQNNIIWLALIAGIVYFEYYYPQHQWKDVKLWISKFLFYFLAATFTIIFALWNKGFVFGDRGNHWLSLNFGNFFFTAFLFFFLFLPLHFANAAKIYHFLKQNRLVWLILIELFLIYLLFYKVTHIYNTLGRHLHNWLVWEMQWHKVITFLPIAYTVLSLCVTKLQRKSFYLLYPFALLFLLTLSVIEVRYSFIPFVLFLLFKERDSERITAMTLATYFVPVYCVMFFLIDASFFP